MSSEEKTTNDDGFSGNFYVRCPKRHPVNVTIPLSLALSTRYCSTLLDATRSCPDMLARTCAARRAVGLRLSLTWA